MVAFRVTLPTPEQVQRIYALDRAGHSVRQITVRTFGTPHRHEVVKDVLRNRHDYDPYVDRVAVDRALTGDVAVWESLTHYERRAVMLAIAERRSRERASDRAWGGARKIRGWVDPFGATPEWVAKLADSFGLSAHRLLGEARRYAAATA